MSFVTILPKMILLLAMENGIEIDSDMFILSNGLFTPIFTCGCLVAMLFGALGLHSRIFEIMRL